jgi:hypothetical protein
MARPSFSNRSVHCELSASNGLFSSFAVGVIVCGAAAHGSAAIKNLAVFRELTQRLDEALARIDQVVATDLKHLNDQLAARNVKVVTAK